MFKGRLISPYQHTGVKWLVERELSGIGGFLCDEMGLGKTVQLIAMMVAQPMKTLIIVPKSIVTQWREEINRFSDLRVTVAPYSILTRDSALLEHRWDRLIMDEAHNIRNKSTKSYKAARNIQARIRWVVTGTPIFNSDKDFKALAAFVGVQATMHNVLRRTKLDVARFNKRLDLPPADFQDVELEMYPEERKLYHEVFDDARQVAKEQYMSKSMHMMDLLEAFLRTRQVLIWPQMYLSGMAKKYKTDERHWDGRSKKLETLMAFISEHPSEKSIVFCQFHGEMNQIQKMLKERGIKTFRIDGQVTDRDTVIRDFKKSDSAVFLIQIKAGGVGLNLQEATRVYIISPSWNPATELQAIGRAHRTGQTNKVYVKRLIYTGSEEYPSVEESILELQDRKTRICAEVLNDQRIISWMPQKRQDISYTELKKLFV